MSGVQNYDWIKEVAEQCEAEYGYKMDSFFAQGWTAAYVAYYALEAAGSTDAAAIRDALAGLELHNDGTDRAFLSGYSAVVFDEKGQNTFEAARPAARSSSIRMARRLLCIRRNTPLKATRLFFRFLLSASANRRTYLLGLSFFNAQYVT